MKSAVCLLVAFACSGAFASEPGQPLDCSDWVFSVPGLSCTTILPFGTDPNGAFLSRGGQREADNTGSLFILREVFDPNQGYLQLVRLDGTTETVVAHLDDRPSLVSGYDAARPTGSSCPRAADSCPAGIRLGNLLTFDRANGRFVIGMNSYDDRGTYNGWSAVAITGFATMFEVLQTYTPTASTVSFTVPYMPEGMAGADSFDTFWGPLTKPLDFTQAHGLQCNYPAAAPHVGDYLTVADPLPNPEPGTGRYYVTSATYQGATRYGRKTTAGHLTGRDPALLPACVP